MTGRAAVWALLLAASAVFLFAVRGVLLPFVISALLAYAASPLVRRLELAGVRRTAAIAGLYLVLAGVCAAAGWYGIIALASEAGDLRAKAPYYAARALPALRAVKIGAFPAGQAAAAWLEGHKEQLVADAARLAPNAAGTLLEAGMYLFIVPFLSFFMMAASRDVLTAALASCPSRHVERLLNLVFALDETIGRYVRGVVVEAALVATLTSAGLWLIGLNYAVWLGVLAGAANVVPYLGFGAAALSAVAVALVAPGEASAGAVVAVFAAAKLADDLLLQPLIMRKAVHLHPVLVLFALSCGAELGGILGMVFAVPAACVLRLLAATALEWQDTEARRSPVPFDRRGRSPVLT
jgi:predicted PurR-regulated permease PerM